MEPIDDLLQVINYIYKNHPDLTINLKSNCNAYFPETRTIRIHHKLKDADKTAALLHEYQHYLQLQYPDAFIKSIDKLNRVNSIVTVIYMETQAWIKSLELSKYLSLSPAVNLAISNQIPTCLYSYIKNIPEWDNDTIKTLGQVYLGRAVTPRVMSNKTLDYQGLFTYGLQLN